MSGILLAIDNMFRDFYGKSPLNQDFIAEVKVEFTEVSNLNLNKFWSDLTANAAACNG